MKIFKFLNWIILFSLLSSCKTALVLPLEAPIQSLTVDVAMLSADDMEGRETGTPGEKKAAKYVADRMKEIGISPRGTDGFYQDFTHRQRHNPHSTVDSPKDKVITGRNVVGYIDNYAKNTVIIGAHLDHLGYGTEGSLYYGPPAIHNGADDNASGVSALLCLAEALIKKKGTTNNNYLFIAFSGEEKGLWGSNFFMDNPTINLVSANYMINMDMVGRLNEERKLAINGVGTSPSWNPEIDAIKSPKFRAVKGESGVGPSDHTSFYIGDIPVLHFFTGQHEHYHKPTDDIEHINFSGLRDISEFIYKLIAGLDDNGKLVFTKTKDESEEVPDFKVTLGVIPDYLFDGKGMRIDGVKENRPAANAGLIKGDIVKKMQNHEVVDMMSYMKGLSMFEKGQTITVVIERDGKEIEKPLTF